MKTSFSFRLSLLLPDLPKFRLSEHARAIRARNDTRYNRIDCPSARGSTRIRRVPSRTASEPINSKGMPVGSRWTVRCHVDCRVLTGSKEAWLIISGTRPDAVPDCNRIMPHGQSAGVGGARCDCERDINSPRRKRFRQRRQPRLRGRLVGRIARRVIALIIIPPQHTFHARVRARFPSFCGRGGGEGGERRPRIKTLLR